MSSGILRNNDMIYNSRQGVPWHGLGIAIDGKMSWQDIVLNNNILNFEVIKAPLFYVNPVYDVQVEMLDTQALIRSDDGSVLGMCSDQYVPIQNTEVFKFMDALMDDPSGPNYETAGQIFNGKKIWAMASLPDFIEVKGVDRVNYYLTCTTSHDGTASAQVFLSPIRVVCQNTLNAALRQTLYTYKIPHRGDVMSKMQEAKAALKLDTVRAEIKLTNELYNSLADVNVNSQMVEDVFNALFDKEIEDGKKSQNRLNYEGRILHLFDNGKGNDIKQVRHTAWTLYNAFTEYEDYYRNATSRDEFKNDKRLNNTLTGARKLEALSAIREVCLA